MNTAVISSIIGTVGAGFIAVLVFYLQGLRDDIRALETRLGERIDGETGLRAELGGRLDTVESRLGAIDGKLARIETVQQEHGRKLDGIADHGERISALEGAVAAMS